MSVNAILRRAFAPNPSLVLPTQRESEVLDAAGVGNPILRSYLVWRRSLMIFTLVATMLSAGLSTYRKVADPEAQPDLFSTIEDRISEELPESAAAEKALKGESEATGHVRLEKLPKEDDEHAPVTTFGWFADIVQLVAIYSLQLAALLVVVVWSRFQLTFQIMVFAFAFSFLVPIAFGLCPWSWWGYVEPTASLDQEPLEYIRAAGEGLLEATEYLFALLPTVLSLVPAVQRACIRVKLLAPQAILPGWFLVLASPFYALFLLVVFVALNQLDSDPLLVTGFLLFLTAPLMYVVRASLFTRPVTTDDDARKIRTTQRIVGVLTSIAGALLLVFFATRQAFGIRLLGLDPAHSLIVPLDLVEFAFEVLSRSMFVTALGADILMRMNLAAWQNSGEFSRSDEVRNYDAVMQQFAALR